MLGEGSMVLGVGSGMPCVGSAASGVGSVVSCVGRAVPGVYKCLIIT